MITDVVNDVVTLAWLDVNVGNTLLRDGQYEEALHRYRRALVDAEKSRDPRDFPTVLSKIATCFLQLGQFHQALEHYEKVRQWCAHHKLPKLAGATEYHIAHLHHLFGEYQQALHLYSQSRELCEKTGDTTHGALCDLRESEVLLELGNPKEAHRLARQAAESFEPLGMNYERAQATVNQAVACFLEGDSIKAAKLFHAARSLFARENNRYWRPMLDLYQAVVSAKSTALRASARGHAERALGVLTHSPFTGKLAFCHSLLARLALAEGNLTAAREQLGYMEKTLHSPALRFQFYYLRGLLHEKGAAPELALNDYAAAIHQLEVTHRALWREELKLSFSEDKTDVYASAIRLCLARGEGGAREAFSWVQRAKTPPPNLAGQTHQSLSACYRQLDAAELAPYPPTPEALQAWRARILEAENDLAPYTPATLSIAAIQQSLPQETTFLEFFPVADRLHAWLLTREGFSHLECGSMTGLYATVRLLQFQLAKFNLGAEYATKCEPALLQSSHQHLHELYVALLEPMQHLFQGAHLVIAPYRFLHKIPFHALVNTEGDSLIDHYTVSYAHSATSFARATLGENPKTRLINLWEVTEDVSAAFMISLYHRFFAAGAADKAEALRNNMLEARESNLHFYYWASSALLWEECES